MKVSQKEVVSLLKEIGVKTADKLTVERLEKKVQALPKLVEDEEVEATSKDGKALLAKLVKAVDSEVEIEITTGDAEKASSKAAKGEKAAAKPSKSKSKDEDDEDEEEEAEEEDEDEEEEAEEEEDEESEDEDEEDEKPAKKAKKTAKSEDDEEDDEEDESEDEDEDEEDEKPAKKSKKEVKSEKKKGKKGGDAFKGPGIIKRIRAIMEKTSKKNPITYEKIVDILKEEFPDRDEKSLLKTTTGQVAYFLRATNKKQENPLDIQRAGRGEYYVAKAKKEE